ncbi:MAG: outer membrane lipoprotein chaperone LolA [Pseudomonadales bacterium]|nr:outer membrane lipoprotein chaperone LolA [Pseudomonadales bacterium]
MSKRALFFLTICAIALQVKAGDHEGQDAIALLEILETTRSFVADFDQLVIDSRGLELENLAGEVSFKRPNRFKWHVKTPFEQLTVFKGDHIFLYEPDLDQLTIQQIDDQSCPNLALILASSGEELLNNFFTQEEFHGNETRRFVLSPKSKDALYTSVKLLFSGNNLIGVSIFDHQGQEVRMGFSNVKVNPVLESANFEIEVPEGTDIVGDVGKSDSAY